MENHNATLKGEQLEQICFHLLCAAGAPEDHGGLCGASGREQPGGSRFAWVIRIIQYIRQIKEGVILPAARPEILKETR